MSLSLHHRDVEALHQVQELELERKNEELSSADANLTRERQARAEVERERDQLAQNQRLLETQLTQLNDNLTQLNDDSLKIVADMARMQSSRTWRWTAPLRRAAGWFGLR